MQDFIPKGNGNSRSLKSSISSGTTWEQALEMLRNGTFPIDIGAVNDSGVAQKGTPINMQTLLSTAVAAKYGKGQEAVPSEIFDLLSRFNNTLGNEYVWRRYKAEGSVRPSGNYVNIEYVEYSSSVTVYDNATIQSGKIVLTGQRSVQITSPQSAAPLVGKYLIALDADQSVEGKPCIIQGGQSIGSGYRFMGSDLLLETSVTSEEFVNSQNPNAYPPSASDGFNYDPAKRLGQFACISVGSYIGTGTNGESDPTSITFDSPPKLLIVIKEGGMVSPATGSGSWKNETLFWVQGITETYTIGKNIASVSISGNTISYYAQSAQYQLNSSGSVYNYFAIL